MIKHVLNLNKAINISFVHWIHLLVFGVAMSITTRHLSWLTYISLYVRWHLREFIVFTPNVHLSRFKCMLCLLTSPKTTSKWVMRSTFSLDFTVISSNMLQNVIFKDFVHHSPILWLHILETKGHYFVALLPYIYHEPCFAKVVRVHQDLVVSWAHIHEK